MERLTEEAYAVLQQSFGASGNSSMSTIIGAVFAMQGSCGERLLTKCQYCKGQQRHDVEYDVQSIRDRPLTLRKGIIINAIRMARSRTGTQWIDTADVIFGVATVLGKTAARVFDEFAISSVAINEAINNDEVHSLAYRPEPSGLMVALRRRLTLSPRERATETGPHATERDKR